MPAPYFALLATIVLLALYARANDLLWAGAVLIGNFVSCAILGLFDGAGVDWIANATMDGASAFLMLCVPVTAPKLWAAAWYVPMLITHAALGFAGHSPWHDYTYLTTLSYLAWGQAITVTGWALTDVVGRVRSTSRRADTHFASDRLVHRGSETRP